MTHRRRLPLQLFSASGRRAACDMNRYFSQHPLLAIRNFPLQGGIRPSFVRRPVPDLPQWRPARPVRRAAWQLAFICGNGSAVRVLGKFRSAAVNPLSQCAWMTGASLRGPCAEVRDAAPLSAMADPAASSPAGPILRVCVCVRQAGPGRRHLHSFPAVTTRECVPMSAGRLTCRPLGRADSLSNPART